MESLEHILTECIIEEPELEFLHSLPEWVYHCFIEVNGKTLVTSGKTFYDLETGKVAAKFPEHVSGRPIYLADCPLFWNGASNMPTTTFYDLEGNVVSRFSQSVYPKINMVNNKPLVLGEDNKTFYDFITGEIAFKIKKLAVPDMINVEGRSLYLGDYKKKMFFDIKTNDFVFELPQKVNSIHGDGINYFYSSNGKTLVRLADHKTFFNLNSRQVAFQVPGMIFGDKIKDIDGKLLVTGYLGDGTTAFYEISTGKKVYSLNVRIEYSPKIINFKGNPIVRGRCQNNDDMGSTFYNLRTGEIAFQLPREVHGPHVSINGRLLFYDNASNYNNPATFLELKFKKLVHCPLAELEKALSQHHQGV